MDNNETCTYNRNNLPPLTINDVVEAYNQLKDIKQEFDEIIMSAENLKNLIKMTDPIHKINNSHACYSSAKISSSKILPDDIVILTLRGKIFKIIVFKKEKENK